MHLHTMCKCMSVSADDDRHALETAVREYEALGFDTRRYTNELAAVHTTLKRLNDAGELRFVARLGPHIAAVKREMDETRCATRTPGRKPS